MYNERKEKLGILNYLAYILIILLILIIVIVIVAKKSSKKTVEKPKEMVLYSEEQLEKIETDYSEDMAANMASFKYNAIDYYKDKLGNEKVDMVLTLQDFYDKHFIEELKVGDTKCEVEVTKKSSEYKLDFTLVCGENKAVMDTYLSKYSYCKNGEICEKKVEKSEKKDNPTPTPTPTPDPVPNPDDGRYTFYEYTLTPSTSVGTYSNWSNWGKDVIEPSLLVEVETKEETETKTGNCTETKEETY